MVQSAHSKADIFSKPGFSFDPLTFHFCHEKLQRGREENNTGQGFNILNP